MRYFEKLRYTYFIFSKPISIQEICEKGSKSSEIYGGLEFSREQRFQRRYQEYVLRQNISDSYKCEMALKRTAFVTFKMVGQDAVKIRRDLRVSLAYLVSGFGKTS